MANRVIRDWTASETIDLLTVKAEIFFTRLIMKADDYGNYTGNPRLINAALFPLKQYEVLEVCKWMEECEKQGLIIMYENDNKKYIHIPNFGQTLRRMKAVYPAPDIDGSLRTSVGQVSDKCGQLTAETKGNETETERKGIPTIDFSKKFIEAFDSLTMDGYKLAFRGIDIENELKLFRLKCDNDKGAYYHRDSAGLRTAFQYQLKNARKEFKPEETVKVYKPGRRLGEGQ